MPTLKELRESRALAQRDLALIAGVAESTIVELEKRRRQPLPSTRRKLARALKVRPLDIDFS
jgi:DNA-binding XRE family transcriptional regulator